MDEALLKDLKRLSVELECNYNDLIEEALRDLLQKHKKDLKPSK